ncbi:hypothetical protein [Fundicoccus culcitae]|uniref:SCP domain-containing protein n=1 Tax=Fundicoccus culcitae TaxID=2969821 RepID=A0ABY5P7C4_9LACT|nr:hypothetical protein [Fundicoccus culcitae]UUX34303.1 hypothetical protein NRE15_01125 [Fundicoccus culcitae]
MRKKIPLSFYVKLIFIVVVFLFTYVSHQSFIDTTLADNSLTSYESFAKIMQEVLGFQQRTEPVIPNQVVSNSEIDHSSPREIDETILSLPNYTLATEKAETFNANLDLVGLNEAFTNKINEQRSQLSWNLMEVGNHLAQGTNQRAFDLSHYHYLSPYTTNGDDFRSLFPEIENNQYRLGENLYELYISSSDIHLDTWSNPQILANYLVEVFEQSSTSELYQNYQSQYISIHAEASDFNIENASYVRLVVVLILDTQMGG